MGAVTGLGKAMVAGALCAALLALPAAAAARVTVTFEFAFGGVVAGGAGLFLYLGGYWESHLAGPDAGGALLEFGGAHPRLGLPIPSVRSDGEGSGQPEIRENLSVDIVRWRF